MQLTPLDAATLAGIPTGTAQTARVVAGELAAVPVGELLQAVVTSVAPREAVLNVNGQQLTIRPPQGQPLQPGTAVLVRVPPTTAGAPNPTIEFAVPKPTASSARPLVGSANLPVPTAASAVAPRVPAPTLAPTRQDAPALPPPRLAVVDVLAPMPDGRVRVQLEGVEQIATATEPLAPGGRYVLQVERNSVGIRLNPPPEGAALPADVATAVLRTPAPTLPAALKPLQAELAQLAAPPTPGAKPLPTNVREAAIAVEATLRTIVPSEPRPPDATQLKQLVENGGLHYEAKLARLVETTDSPLAASRVQSMVATSENVALVPSAATSTLEPKAASELTKPQATEREPAKADSAPGPKEASEPAKPQAAERAPVKTEGPSKSDMRGEAATAKPQAAATEVGRSPDLKGDLLRLLQAVNDLGGGARAPAAEAAVRGIEAQQAANVLAQANNAPYFLQVPFPDGSEWKTLRLSLEPQYRPDEQADAGRAGRFRVFMHVPLTDLGETWIDAGLTGESFRATIYLDRSVVRDRVRAALPELHAELAAEGFSEVLLDVRSSGELPAGRRRDAGAVQAGRPGSVSVLDVRA